MGTVIRPPSEAGSIILQVSLGCSHNKCLFCGTFRDKTFGAKAANVIESDIQFAALHYRDKKSLFLADGDALALPQVFLENILRQIKGSLPWVKRVNSYASPGALLSKTAKELSILRELGLSRLYMGVESGSDKVLSLMNKGHSANGIIEAARKAKYCGFYLSTSIILGLGGKAFSQTHIKKTAQCLGEIQPNHIGALTLRVLPDTPLAQLVKNKKFSCISTLDVLSELKLLLETLTVDRVQFHANHASNHLPLSGVLGHDKEKFITMIESAISGHIPLMPDYMRSL